MKKFSSWKLLKIGWKIVKISFFIFYSVKSYAKYEENSYYDNEKFEKSIEKHCNCCANYKKRRAFKKKYCDCRSCNKKVLRGGIIGGGVGAGIGAAVATNAGIGAAIGGPVGLVTGLTLSEIL